MAEGTRRNSFHANGLCDVYKSRTRVREQASRTKLLIGSSLISLEMHGLCVHNVSLSASDDSPNIRCNRRWFAIILFPVHRCYTVPSIASSARSSNRPDYAYDTRFFYISRAHAWTIIEPVNRPLHELPDRGSRRC